MLVSASWPTMYGNKFCIIMTQDKIISMLRKTDAFLCLPLNNYNKLHELTLTK